MLKRAFFFARGLAWSGRRYVCPCCGWSLRAFVAQRGVVSSNSDGYCPRCNSKARHRRIWIYLEEKLNLSALDRQLLEIAPWPSFARRLLSMPNIRYSGLDLGLWNPHATILGDARDIPAPAGSFDLALCVHVLEHVWEDRRVMGELHRVLKPGGVAIVTVPIRLDRDTHEDPAITDPKERQRVFGEYSHVRYYGRDLADRLSGAGFEVTLDLASELPPELCRKFGLRNDENIFHCVKAAAPRR